MSISLEDIDRMSPEGIWTKVGYFIEMPPSGLDITVPTGKDDMPVTTLEPNAPDAVAGVVGVVRKTTRPGMSFGSTTTVRYAVSAINSYAETLPYHLPSPFQVGHSYEIALTVPYHYRAVGYRFYRMDGERFRTKLLFIGSIGAQPNRGESVFVDRNGWAPNPNRTWRLKADDYLFKYAEMFGDAE